MKRLALALALLAFPAAAHEVKTGTLCSKPPSPQPRQSARPRNAPHMMPSPARCFLTAGDGALPPARRTSAPVDATGPSHGSDRPDP
jgi:hypothetical protein